MKQPILLLLALFTISTLMADEPYKVYCALSARHSETSTTAISRVEVDYGQERLTKNHLVDDYGRALQYNSITAVANLFSRLGWEFEDSYVAGEDGDRAVWIMSKMVTSEDEITEGFTTRYMYENSGQSGIRQH